MRSGILFLVGLFLQLTGASDVELDALRRELAILRNETLKSTASLADTLDVLFLLLMAVVIFFMQAGFSMLEAGHAREQSTRGMQPRLRSPVSAMTLWPSLVRRSLDEKPPGLQCRSPCVVGDWLGARRPVGLGLCGQRHGIL